MVCIEIIFLLIIYYYLFLEENMPNCHENVQYNNNNNHSNNSINVPKNYMFLFNCYYYFRKLYIK